MIFAHPVGLGLQALSEALLLHSFCHVSRCLCFGLAVLLEFLILKARILTKCSQITPAKNRLLLHFTCH